jgi:hypothetical protein
MNAMGTVTGGMFGPFRTMMGWFTTCANCGMPLALMHSWDGSFTCTPGGCGAQWTQLWEPYPPQQWEPVRGEDRIIATVHDGRSCHQLLGMHRHCTCCGRLESECLRASIEHYHAQKTQRID